MYMLYTTSPAIIGLINYLIQYSSFYSDQNPYFFKKIQGKVTNMSYGDLYAKE